MLIARLINKQRQEVALQAAVWQQQHAIYQTQYWFFHRSLTRFCTSLPALSISFAAGFIMQARHHHAVKIVRRVVGFSWLRSVIS